MPLGSSPESVFLKIVIRITVHPAFTSLARRDHRMTRSTSVFGRVLIRRTIATKCDVTLLARSEVHPRVTGFYTCFADSARRQLNISDGFNVCAHFVGP